MNRTCIVSGACLVIALCAPASAQAQDNGNAAQRKRGPDIATVGFSPTSGAPGTTVTIHGKGFTKQTRLMVGGRPVSPVSVGPKELVFTVPDSYGDGTIVLRHPGVARDIAVGRFSVVESARISAFSPQAGSPGTRVEVRGTGFRRGDKVLMNGKPLAIATATPQRLVVTIAADATTDYLTVASANGTQVRTDALFTVLTAAPAITGVTPDGGPPGTPIRISGQNFTPEDTVLYGKDPLAVVARTGLFVDVNVPIKARDQQFLVVVGPSGQARSPQKFSLELPAAVSRVVPSFGKAGETIEIHGKNFLAKNKVTLGGVPLGVIQLRSTQITAVIPEGATSGPIVIEHGPMRVLSKKVFEVIAQPVIQSFVPAGGKPGTKVTITGQHFDSRSVVYYGSKPVRVLARKGDHTLVVQVPKKAAEEAFKIRTRGGEATSSTAFQVYLTPVVTAIEPRRGVTGSQVTLRGRNLGYATRVLVGDVPLAIVSRTPDNMIATIPPEAIGGPISVQSVGQTSKTRLRFAVIGAAQITAMKPRSGPPGVEITIAGRGFTDATKILFGGKELSPVRRDKGTIVVKLPRGIKVADTYLLARNGLSETRSPEPFKVVAPAAISGFSPERVEAGAVVVITGKNFTAETKVLWGDLELAVSKLDPRGRRLEVTIPANAVGARYLFVDDGGARYRARAELEVRTPPPRIPPPGSGSKAREQRGR